MNDHWNACDCHGPLSRREMLRQSAAGFAGLALAGLLADEAAAAVRADPLAPRPPHFPAKAKRVIFLFMHGGPSQVDTFDYKPLLERDHGKPLPFAKPRVVSSQTGNLLQVAVEVPAARPERRLGQRAVSARRRRASTTCASSTRCTARTRRHGGALLELHTGSDTFVRPSMGSWITYGLGTENRDLPGFITICPTLAHGGVNNCSSAFLPAAYQGTPLGNASIPADRARDPVHRKRSDAARLAAAGARPAAAR